MKTLRIVKKLGSDMSPHEEKVAAECLAHSRNAIAIIHTYLQREIISIDNQLNNVHKLYTSSGHPDTYVAALLGERATQMKLLSLLSEEIEILDADHAGD